MMENRYEDQENQALADDQTFRATRVVETVRIDDEEGKKQVRDLKNHRVMRLSLNVSPLLGRGGVLEVILLRRPALFFFRSIGMNASKELEQGIQDFKQECMDLFVKALKSPYKGQDDNQAPKLDAPVGESHDSTRS